jgi:predicted DNA binding protein
MLRLEFSFPRAGVAGAVLDAVPEAESVEVDNVLPMPGGRAMQFLTVACTAACDTASITEALDGQVLYAGSGIDDGGTRHALVVIDFATSALSTLVGEGCVPHRLVARRGSTEAVVTVRDWTALRDLAATVEREYGTFDLGGTTELDRPGYPLGRDKFEYGLRNHLTADQIDVLRTAYEMGHFAVPQQATSGEVASALDISRSTLSERLRRAQNNLLWALFGHSR